MNLKEYFKKYTKQSKKGFTLVEAITVVIIMSIISTASISVFLSVRDTVRDTSNITTDQHRADQIEQFLRNEFQTASKIDLVELEGQAPKDFSPVKNDEYMLYNPENEQLIFKQYIEKTTPAGKVLDWKEKFIISDVKEVKISLCPINYDSASAGSIPYKMIYKLKTKNYVYSGGIVMGNSYLGDEGVFEHAGDVLSRIGSGVSSTNSDACDILWHKNKNADDPNDPYDVGIDFTKLQNGAAIIFHNEGTQILTTPPDTP